MRLALRALLNRGGDDAFVIFGAKASGKVGHKAEGRLDAIDPKANTVMVSHGPVPSLNWPSMTMEFTLANDGLVKDIKPGTPIALEFVERKPGEWVITKLESKK